MTGEVPILVATVAALWLGRRQMDHALSGDISVPPTAFQGLLQRLTRVS